jgi:hypothetical protein
MSGDFKYADKYTTKQKSPRTMSQDKSEEPPGTRPHLLSLRKDEWRVMKGPKLPGIALAGESIGISILNVCPIPTSRL